MNAATIAGVFAIIGSIAAIVGLVIMYFSKQSSTDSGGGDGGGTGASNGAARADTDKTETFVVKKTMFWVGYWMSAIGSVVALFASLAEVFLPKSTQQTGVRRTTTTTNVTRPQYAI